jgi:hypothetical protein
MSQGRGQGSEHAKAARRACVRPTCVSSSTSSSSPRKSTSLCELVSGQNLSSPRMTGSASRGSFSTNCTNHIGNGGHPVSRQAAKARSKLVLP